jgi:hypothetical protein
VERAFLHGPFVQQKCRYGSRRGRDRRFDSALPLHGLLLFQPISSNWLDSLEPDATSKPSLRAPEMGEKVGCAKIEMEACITGQRTLQRTKQDFVVIAQIFDHCQLARMHSLTLLQAVILRHRAERVGAKHADAFAGLSFISTAAISAGYNSAGCATRSRDPLRLLPSVLALPGKPYRLAFPPPVQVPSEGASERPANSFRCAANGDIQIRVRCLLKERSARGQEFRGDLAGLISSSPGAIDIRDADPDAPDPSAETAEGKIQPPLNV